MANSMFMSGWTGKGSNKTPTVDNLAKIFTPHIPICGPDYDPERMVVLTDVPTGLKKALREGLTLIDTDCLRQNAEVLFHLYESLCSQHVLGQQMDSKLIRRLTQRDPSAAVSENTRLAAQEHFSRSSLIGKDPYGDLARPAPEREGPLQAAAGPALADGPAAAAVRGPSTFSDLQLLMMEVQDKTYLYLTVHLEKLLTPAVYDWVKEEDL